MCATALWPTVNKPFCLMSMACVCACKGGGSEPGVRQRGYFFYHEHPVSFVISDQIQWFLMRWLVWETCAQMFCLPRSNLDVWSISHHSSYCRVGLADMIWGLFLLHQMTPKHDFCADGKMSICAFAKRSATHSADSPKILPLLIWVYFLP